MATLPWLPAESGTQQRMIPCQHPGSSGATVCHQYLHLINLFQLQMRQGREETREGKASDVSWPIGTNIGSCSSMLKILFIICYEDLYGLFQAKPFYDPMILRLVKLHILFHLCLFHDCVQLLCRYGPCASSWSSRKVGAVKSFCIPPLPEHPRT